MSARALVSASTLIALLAANPAAAGGNRIVVWNERIAAAIDEAVTEDGVCRSVRRPGFNRGCAERELNRHRAPFVAVSFLDEVALLVNRLTTLVLDEEIAERTRVEFVGEATNVFKRDVEAHVYLKFEW